MKKVNLYTDGSCLGNPGKGGWCAILEYNGTEKVLTDGEKETTNNKMELTAAIKGLSALKEQCEVTLYSDSKYLIDSVTKGWVYSWREKGWRKSDKSMALNIDLWEQLLELLEYHTVEFIWVKGHNGNEMNERCDEIAVKSANMQ